MHFVSSTIDARTLAKSQSRLPYCATGSNVSRQKNWLL